MITFLSQTLFNPANPTAAHIKKYCQNALLILKINQHESASIEGMIRCVASLHETAVELEHNQRIRQKHVMSIAKLLQTVAELRRAIISLEVNLEYKQKQASQRLTAYMNEAQNCMAKDATIKRLTEELNELRGTTRDKAG